MTTFVNTNEIQPVKLGGEQGEVAEIANRALCGAEDFTGMLRWLNNGERLEAEALADTHQLIYLMDGSGVINLQSKDYDVAKGAGIYLGPSETASIRQTGGDTLKLFHLVVPIKKA